MVSLREAVDRERETRHWTIEQWQNEYGSAWPSKSARIRREADNAVDELFKLNEAMLSIVKPEESYEG